MQQHSLSLKPQLKRIDKPLLAAVVALALFGIAMVFDASVADSARTFSDKFFFLKRQAIWVGIGLFVMIGFSLIRYTFWRRVALPFLIFTVFLLALVLVPGLGITALGATRRISLGVAGIGLQPSELAKLALAIYLSSSLYKKATVLGFLLPTLLICGLIIAEPDLGTTLVVAGSAFATYWAAGAPVIYFLALLMAGFAAALVTAFVSSYRRARISAFFDPNIDPTNTSYHIRQILIALASGGLFGLGPGQSRQKYLFLPEPATDSIFAIIAEEFGFIGAATLLFVFMFVVWRGFKIAWSTDDPFGRLLAVNITSWIGIQVLINLGAMVAIVPLTGVPLPFVSYGGSAIIVLLAACGILLNISKNTRTEKQRS